MNALENGSEYEFCGKIRSSLEQIAKEVIIRMGKEKTDKFHLKLQTLKVEGIIDNKLAKAIHSNYSYGSQFIHNETSLSSAEAKLFVDQTIYHIEFLIKKMKEIDTNDFQ